MLFLQLRRPIAFNDKIHPIDIINYEIAVGTNCRVSGWGDIAWKGPRATILQHANVTIFDKDACNSSYSYGGIITNGMICANGQTKTGEIIDVCQGG